MLTVVRSNHAFVSSSSPSADYPSTPPHSIYVPEIAGKQSSFWALIAALIVVLAIGAASFLIWKRRKGNNASPQASRRGDWNQLLDNGDSVFELPTSYDNHSTFDLSSKPTLNLAKPSLDLKGSRLDRVVA